MGIAILVGLVIILLVVGIFAYLITIYNSLVRLKNDIDKAWANIDVLLKQRHDELPKLIETCKGYMQYEQKTFQLITEARTAFMKAGSIGEKAQADNDNGPHHEYGDEHSREYHVQFLFSLPNFNC